MRGKTMLAKRAGRYAAAVAAPGMLPLFCDDLSSPQ